MDHHRATNADITIGCLPVGYDRASDFGLMKIDDQGRCAGVAGCGWGWGRGRVVDRCRGGFGCDSPPAGIIDFAEKPKGKELRVCYSSLPDVKPPPHPHIK